MTATKFSIWRHVICEICKKNWLKLPIPGPQIGRYNLHPLIEGHHCQLDNQCKETMINNNDCWFGQLTNREGEQRKIERGRERKRRQRRERKREKRKKKGERNTPRINEQWRQCLESQRSPGARWWSTICSDGPLFPSIVWPPPSSVCSNHRHSKSFALIESDPSKWINIYSESFHSPLSSDRNVPKIPKRVPKLFFVPKTRRSAIFPGVPQLVIGC